MYFSKHNIVSRIKDSDDYFIVNPLSGNADILSNEEVENIKNRVFNNREEYLEKGYLVDEESEKLLFNQKYLDFIDERDDDEVQIFFVPSYGCNFSCSYCYQEEYHNSIRPLDTEVIDAFFRYIDSEFSDRRKYVTLFGGEPLMNSGPYKEKIRYFIDRLNERKLQLAIVTNGYNLSDYIEILKKASIREIQVTLDGTKTVHDRRRMLKGGNGTFDFIVKGIDKCLENGFPVNLRAVVDRENVSNLSDLADFSIEKGWTDNPLFKTQLGRNYELHTCQSNQKKLFDRIGMWQEIYEIIKKKPEFLKFHKPAFSISKFIFENGELPFPLYDSCSGCKTEWAFDYTGNFYACTATVGKEGESLGTYYPEISKREDDIEEWQDRDILAIEKCRSCEVQLACGGGCASIAKNSSGSLHSHDCRPIKELLELGIATYYK